MDDTKKCPSHREAKIEMLKSDYQNTYLIKCCLYCWEDKEYKEVLSKYEKKLSEFKSQSFLGRIFESETKKPSRWDTRKFVRDWANYQKKQVKEFKQKLRQEYYRLAPSDFKVILKLGGVEFENYIEALFQKQGYEVTKTPASGDGGVDLVISKKVNGRVMRTAVQCKRYTKSVGVSAIQEVFTGKHIYKCKNGMVITTSEYTIPAIKTAKQLKVILWNKYKLIEEINKTLKSMSNTNLSWEEYLSKHIKDDAFPN